MPFLQTPEHLKTEAGEESFNPDGLAQRSIKLLKDTFPDVEVSLAVSCMHAHVTLHLQCFASSTTVNVYRLDSLLLCRSCDFSNQNAACSPATIASQLSTCV